MTPHTIPRSGTHARGAPGPHDHRLRTGTARTGTPGENEDPAAIASNILASSPYHPIRFLQCTFSDGVLTIGGRLPSFHLRQVAQTEVQGIAGVREIRNRIEVTR